MENANELEKKFRKELNSGTASLVLLSVISQAEEPKYGYQIAKDIEIRNEDTPMMKQGALYPVLRSLEASGLLQSQVEPSVSGPPRRYYQITEAGLETLQSWKNIWFTTNSFINSILRGEDA